MAAFNTDKLLAGAKKDGVSYTFDDVIKYARRNKVDLTDDEISQARKNPQQGFAIVYGKKKKKKVDDYTRANSLSKGLLDGISDAMGKGVLIRNMKKKKVDDYTGANSLSKGLLDGISDATGKGILIRNIKNVKNKKDSTSQISDAPNEGGEKVLKNASENLARYTYDDVKKYAKKKKVRGYTE